MIGVRTSVKGVRLTDYQSEKLKDLAKERGITDTDYIRALIDEAIEGRTADLRNLKRVADDKKISLQRLIDLVVEQIEPSRDQERRN